MKVQRALRAKPLIALIGVRARKAFSNFICAPSKVLFSTTVIPFNELEVVGLVLLGVLVLVGGLRLIVLERLLMGGSVGHVVQVELVVHVNG